MEAWRAALHGVTKSWTRLSNSAELNIEYSVYIENFLLFSVDLFKPGSKLGSHNYLHLLT